MTQFYNDNHEVTEKCCTLSSTFLSILPERPEELKKYSFSKQSSSSSSSISSSSSCFNHFHYHHPLIWSMLFNYNKIINSKFKSEMFINQNRIYPIIWIVLYCSLLMPIPLVRGSGFFELQFIEGIRNSTTIHICLKEFWNSQINFNRCTFGQKTIVYHEYSHPKQSTIKIPFSFRWIVSFD